tara:strand:+ start:149 stop:1372 length:1224 start_codon:yes stop_codon:yes gene_type:complete
MASTKVIGMNPDIEYNIDNDSPLGMAAPPSKISRMFNTVFGYSKEALDTMAQEKIESSDILDMTGQKMLPISFRYDNETDFLKYHNYLDYQPTECYSSKDQYKAVFMCCNICGRPDGLMDATCGTQSGCFSLTGGWENKNNHLLKIEHANGLPIGYNGIGDYYNSNGCIAPQISREQKSHRKICDQIISRSRIFNALKNLDLSYIIRILETNELFHDFFKSGDHWKLNNRQLLIKYILDKLDLSITHNKKRINFSKDKNISKMVKLVESIVSMKQNRIPSNKIDVKDLFIDNEEYDEVVIKYKEIVEVVTDDLTKLPTEELKILSGIDGELPYAKISEIAKSRGQIKSDQERIKLIEHIISKIPKNISETLGDVALLSRTRSSGRRKYKKKTNKFRNKKKTKKIKYY